MLREKMYVRCPADHESITDPRIFVCGQIMSIDEFRENSIAKMKLSKDEKMEFERFLEKFKSKGYGGK